MLHAAHLLRYERLFAARANRASLEERRMGLVTDLAAAVARIAALEAQAALMNGFTASVQQVLAGDVIGTTLTAFTAAGAFINWPASVTPRGAEIEIEAWLDVVGDGAANNYVARLYWGGLASGVALNADTALGAQVANDLRLRARVKYSDIVTPGWESWADLTTPANNAYIQSRALFGQATQPVTALVPIQAAVQYVGGGTPDATDQIRLRKLSARMVMPALVV